jgi:hypothetical protein
VAAISAEIESDEDWLEFPRTGSVVDDSIATETKLVQDGGRGFRRSICDFTSSAPSRTRPGNMHFGRREWLVQVARADFSRMWTPHAEPSPITWASPILAPSI